MTYHLQCLKTPERPPNFVEGELLLMRISRENPQPGFFVYLGQVGEFLRMGRVRFDKVAHKVETVEEVTVPSRQRDQFSRILGLVAVAG